VKAAGGVGIVRVDNRAGEANGIPIELAVPGGMISDLDGAALRAYLAGTAGRTGVRIGRGPQLQVDPPDIVRLLVQQGRLAVMEGRVETTFVPASGTP